jgi:hypothetical protein
MTNIFQKAFVHVLREEPELPEISDSEAMQQSLDKGTNPQDFDVDGGAAADHIAATSKMQQQMVSALQMWIQSLEEFSNSLNGTGPDSMQSKLKNCVPDSLFDKIRVAETKKIARVSMEVSSLNEMLKGYLASSGDAKYKGV